MQFIMDIYFGNKTDGAKSLVKYLTTNSLDRRYRPLHDPSLLPLGKNWLFPLQPPYFAKTILEHYVRSMYSGTIKRQQQNTKENIITF